MLNYSYSQCTGPCTGIYINNPAVADPALCLLLPNLGGAEVSMNGNGNISWISGGAGNITETLGIGIRRFYIVKVPVTIKTGGLNKKSVRTNHYYGKFYYYNVKNRTVLREADVTSTNGWKKTSKGMYDRQQKYPAAYTIPIDGANQPARMIAWPISTVPDLASGIFGTFTTVNTPPSNNGTMDIMNNGTIPAAFTAQEVSPNGAIVRTITTTAVLAPGDVSLSIPYVITAGNFINVIGGNGVMFGTFNPSVKGDRAPDTICRYGMDTPIPGVDYQTVIN